MGTTAREALQLTGEYCCGFARTSDQAQNVFDSLDAVFECSPDVLLDLTTQPATFEIATAAVGRGVATLVGASGWTDEQRTSLKAVAEERGVGALIVPNFSLGAVLMMRFAQEAARICPMPRSSNSTTLPRKTSPPERRARPPRGSSAAAVARCRFIACGSTDCSRIKRFCLAVPASSDDSSRLADARIVRGRDALRCEPSKPCVDSRSDSTRSSRAAPSDEHRRGRRDRRRRGNDLRGLEERRLPVGELGTFASRTHPEGHVFAGTHSTCGRLARSAFRLRRGLLRGGEDASEAYASALLERGSVVIDNSATFRLARGTAHRSRRQWRDAARGPTAFRLQTVPRSYSAPRCGPARRRRLARHSSRNVPSGQRRRAGRARRAARRRARRRG